MVAAQSHLHSSTDLEHVVSEQIPIIIKHNKNTLKMRNYLGSFFVAGFLCSLHRASVHKNHKLWFRISNVQFRHRHSCFLKTSNDLHSTVHI